VYLKSDKKIKSDQESRPDRNISPDDVEKILVLKSWHASFFVLPVAKKLILFFSNNRILTPNQITLAALFFRISAAILFLCNSHIYMIAGGISYYIAYLFDCVDGSVARLTNQASELGRYLDHVSDLAGDLLILFSLAYSQDMLFTFTVSGMAFFHIAESYISYLAGFALKSNNNIAANSGILNLFNKYRKWWFDKNYKSFISFPDYTFFVFIIMPILGMPKNGLKIGFFLLSAIVLYTMFSTFVSLHTKEKRFP